MDHDGIVASCPRWQQNIAEQAPTAMLAQGTPSRNPFHFIWCFHLRDKHATWAQVASMPPLSVPALAAVTFVMHVILHQAEFVED